MFLLSFFEHPTTPAGTMSTTLVLRMSIYHHMYQPGTKCMLDINSISFLPFIVCSLLFFLLFVRSVWIYWYGHASFPYFSVYFYFLTRLPLLNHSQYLLHNSFAFSLSFVSRRYCSSFRSSVCCLCLVVVSSTKSILLPSVSTRMRYRNHAFIMIISLLPQIRVNCPKSNRWSLFHSSYQRQLPLSYSSHDTRG